MPEWWARRMTWAVPAKLLEVARRVTSGEESEKQALGNSLNGGGAPINIGEFNLPAGESVRQMRQLVAALFKQMTDAYAKGQPVDHISARYNKSQEQLRKLEKDERESLLAMGEYLPKAEVEHDYASAAEMLKQMRESMERRLIELCPWLNAKERELLRAAVHKVRSQEDRALQRLPLMKSNDAFLVELQAA